MVETFATTTAELERLSDWLERFRFRRNHTKKRALRCKSSTGSVKVGIALVKELRLAGIDTPEAGNAFLPGFLEAHNARFAKAPFSDRNAHRPLTERDNLDEVFAWREERTVTQSLTLQYDQTLFLLEPNEVTRSLVRQRVVVCDYPDGRLAIKHKGRELPYRVFDKRQRVNQAAIVENKRLGPVLAYIAERQTELDMSRSRRAPSRRGQAAGLFKVG